MRLRVAPRGLGGPYRRVSCVNEEALPLAEDSPSRQAEEEEEEADGDEAGDGGRLRERKAQRNSPDMDLAAGCIGAGGETELWRECAEWLIRAGVVDRSHRVMLPSASVMDFAQILRDGVVICQLAHRLAPNSIDMRAVNLRPQLSQFLCLKNICAFLRACGEHFDLPPSELFEAWQLYKVADFAKVLVTLSRLSHSAKARKSGLRGFPDLGGGAEPGASQPPPSDYYNLSDDIYRSLADQAESREISEEPYRVVGEEEEYGKIYDVIVTRQDVAPATPSRPPQATTDFTPVEKRDHVIKELVDTERNYVDALNMMLKKFYSPLRPVLSTEDHKTVFMNLQELANIHSAFLSEMGRAGRESVVGAPSASSSPNLGQVFLRWKPKLVAYSEYCASLTKAQARVETLCDSSASIKSKIIECQADANENRFRLQDLLAVPMQRVLKYHLILRELDKATPAGHSDKASVAKALQAMLDLSLYINEVKGDSEMLKLVADIQSSIADLTMPDNTQLKDYGRLLKDGELRLCSHEDRKLKNRYIFVFDKVLMVCKNVKGSSYTYKSAIILGDYRLEREPSADSVSKGLGTLMKGGKAGLSFSLVHKGGENVVQLHLKSREAADAWWDAVAMAHDNVCPAAQSSSEHGWQYTSVASATECAACEKLLRGLFYQGYRCQACGALVHKECIPDAPPCAKSRQALQRPMSFAPHDVNSPVGQKFRAARSFTGNNGGSEFLAFRENDIVQVISTDTGSEGWWRGRIVDGPHKDRTGLFPADSLRRQKRPDRTDTWHGLATTPTNAPGGALVPPATIPEMAPAASTPSPTGYVNMDELGSYRWYCGALERQTADERLCGLPNGTFLLRFSEKQRRYVISIAYEGEVKHVKVEQGPSGFWLDETPDPFPSVVELVRYYGEHNMAESFQSLDTTLAYPFRKSVLSVATALHNFEPTSQSMVGLRKGQEVLVLSKNGDERGWWKGKVRGKIGYFPLAYVREAPDATASHPPPPL